MNLNFLFQNIPLYIPLRSTADPGDYFEVTISLLVKISNPNFERL
jgi:hypothetical protein